MTCADNPIMVREPCPSTSAHASPSTPSLDGTQLPPPPAAISVPCRLLPEKDFPPPRPRPAPDATAIARPLPVAPTPPAGPHPENRPHAPPFRKSPPSLWGSLPRSCEFLGTLLSVPNAYRLKRNIHDLIRTRVRTLHYVQIIQRRIVPPRPRPQLRPAVHSLVRCAFFGNLVRRLRMMNNTPAQSPHLRLRLQAHEFSRRRRVELRILARVRLPQEELSRQRRKIV